MKVIKKVNNNVALAVNDRNEEVFVVGKGLGFLKTPYEITDENIIEKIYVAPKNIKMFDILNDIPIEDICLAEEIIQAGKRILEKELNSNLLLTLSDHISFALQRSKSGSQVKSPLEWEVKNLYPEETKVGQEALKIVKEKTGVSLPQSEVTFIALHFVNAQTSSGDMSETTKITAIIGEILSIIKYHFKIDFDETSLNFTRFITHMRYFIKRQMSSKALQNENEEIFQMVRVKYIEEIKCVEKIEKFLEDNYGWSCSNDEKLYLVLHIQRLTSKSNK
jgi:beta-glucoside operon transcriptional antiterminator